MEVKEEVNNLRRISLARRVPIEHKPNKIKFLFLLQGAPWVDRFAGTPIAAQAYEGELFTASVLEAKVWLDEGTPKVLYVGVLPVDKLDYRTFNHWFEECCRSPVCNNYVLKKELLRVTMVPFSRFVS